MKGETPAMHLYLLRHGVAEDSPPGSNDAERALTRDGRRKLAETLGLAAQAGVHPSLILTSPYKRAVQTAEMAKQLLGHPKPLQQTSALTPNASAKTAWEEIRGHRSESSLLLVGHNPLFTDLAAFLLGTPGLLIDFKKGAMLRIDLEHFTATPRGVLRWYLISKLAPKGL